MNTDLHRLNQVKNEKRKVKDKNSSLFFIRISLKLSAFIRIYLWLIFLFFYGSPFAVSAQSKIAVLVPDKGALSLSFVEKLEDALSDRTKILDGSLSAAAYRIRSYDKPFNLTLLEAKNVGAAIGCDYFLLVKAENLRRNSLAKGEFYESYAVIYAVSARTGKLFFWNLDSFKSEKPESAEKKLFDSINALAAEISDKIKNINKEEASEKSVVKPEELPEEDSPEAKNFRPPLPYKRMHPDYTPLANLYAVEATVDIEIDVDESGKILKTEIVRWAGYGLDEAVASNIRRMNWQPAIRSGKTLPMRILLRYNFKKIEKE